jgi:hypothetical protein
MAIKRLALLLVLGALAASSANAGIILGHPTGGGGLKPSTLPIKTQQAVKPFPRPHGR